MALSPNKKYIAVAESGENPVVAIYDTTTRKRRKVLSMPELGSRVCLPVFLDTSAIAPSMEECLICRVWLLSFSWSSPLFVVNLCMTREAFCFL